ncbi:MAG: eukaryotic-like serine/threonine-protein kinase [Acidimicrobiaceae bacterium]
MVSRLHDQIGRVLGGRYRLIAPVGTGASALVFLADDTRLRRRVAVKLLHKGLAEDEAFLRRFRAEAQAAAALNHPHILAVYDWGEDEHEPYLVTEYLGGGSLRAMLDKGQSLTVSQGLLVGLEAARALDYAHKRGFVHRDIKPANLLFGEEGRLRIADFGLARALAEAAWTEPAGVMVGTARYACPEQARGEKVDGKGDVYSLGLVIIEAVTGTVPFASDTTIATLMARIDKPVDVPESLGPLRKLLARVGMTDPAERPDAGDLAVGLLAAAEELPRPEPLPLAGATASADEITVIEGDRTQVPPTGAPSVDATAAIVATGVVPTGGATTAMPTGTTAAPVVAGAAAPPADLPGNQVASRRAQRKAEIRAGVRKRRWTKVLLAILVVLALVVGSLLTYNAVHVVTHKVPSFLHMTKDAAAAEVAASHWTLATKEARDDNSSPGEVIAQDIDVGKSLAEHKTITLTISLGKTLVDVPITALAGKTVAEATQLLQDNILTIGTLTEQNDEVVLKGTVISADPSTPPQLPKDSPVNLIVSSGPAPRTVPALTSAMTFEQAAAALAAVQLVAVRDDQFNDDVPAGQVVGADPPPGAQADRGSNVKIVVSKGPHVVPDVSRLSVSDASDALTAAGFTIKGVTGDPKRTVSATDPPAGTKAKAGTPIQIITR